MRIDPFEPFPDAGPTLDDGAPLAATSIRAETTAAAAAAPPVVAAAAGPAAYVGPFDRAAWPERLPAHVVSTGDDPRIHGYAVAGDLARHCGVADVAWLTLRGELPSPVERAAFEAAIVLLAPVHVGQAASHATLLARLAGAEPGAMTAIGAVGLGELGRTEREALAPWLAWLEAADDGDPGVVPDAARAIDPSADAIAAQAWLDAAMRAWFGPSRGLPGVSITRVAAAYALLHRLGLRGALVAEAIAIWARLPAVIAEAAHVKPGAIRAYPARLPDFQYVDDRGAQP